MTKRKFLVEIESNKVDEPHCDTYEVSYSAKILSVDNFTDHEENFCSNGTWCSGDSIGEAFEDSLLAVLFEKND